MKFNIPGHVRYFEVSHEARGTVPELFLSRAKYPVTPRKQLQLYPLVCTPLSL